MHEHFYHLHVIKNFIMMIIPNPSFQFSGLVRINKEKKCTQNVVIR